MPKTRRRLAAQTACGARDLVNSGIHAVERISTNNSAVCNSAISGHICLASEQDC